jgi:hypothetical protein
MILAIIPLIPLAWVAGAAATAGVFGWFKGRSNRKKELDRIKKRQENMKHGLAVMAARQKQHEDDLNGVIANQETGQTAEEVEFGIFPKKYKIKEIKEIKDDKVDDRFELLDL